MSYEHQSNGSGAPLHQRERVVRFGSFEFRPDLQELRKNGIRIKVQSKPLQILRALIDRPGELVTRDELCRELWPEGTFVDFESGLNTATNRLRVALHDSAESPRYIETLPRLGYRFICPVVTPQPPAEIPNSNPAPVTSEPVRSYVARPSLRNTMLVLLPVLLIAFATYLYLGTKRRLVQPAFHPLTYKAQVIYSARFLPGAKSAVYSAFSEPEGVRTLRSNIAGSNIQPAFVGDGTLASISPSGDLAVFDKVGNQEGPQLSRVSPSGRKSSLDAKNARALDWLPNGKEVALIRRVAVESTIEFPAGRVAYRCSGWITDLRVSPNGEQVAFIEHPTRDDDRGHLRLVDRNGKTKQLTTDWNSAAGLAWSRSGREVWFTASKAGVARSLYAVSIAGQVRRISNTPASLHLFDISADGRLLLSVDDLRGAMLAEFPGAPKETDLTEFDEPNVQAMSRDGERILFTESGDAGGQHYTTLLFDNARHSSRIIGSGRAMALSPDGLFALLLDPQDDTALTLVSLEAGSSRRILGHGLHYQWARFLSKSAILAGGSYSTGRLMLYRQSMDGGAPTALSGFPYLDNPTITPDGEKLAGFSGRDLMLVNFCDKSARPLPVQPGNMPVAWSADTQSLFLINTLSVPPQFMKLDIDSNSRTLWKPLHISQSSLAQLGGIVAAPDAGAYAYSIHQDLSRLYVVDGWS